MLRSLMLLAALAAAPGCADAAPPASPPAAGIMSEAAAARLAYNALLGRHVDPAGGVDYAGLAQDRVGLDAYVAALAHVDLAAVSEDARLAELINAYNAFTLALILDNLDGGRLASIMDLDGGKTWDVKRWRLGGQDVSLGQIENELIRPVFNEPRIHWALVCAAYSCPPLRSEAYTADRLEAQLADQARYVHTHDRYLRHDAAANTLGVTRIYEWYGADFGPDVRAYVQGQGDFPGEPALGFLDYDWRLNSQANVSR